MSVLTSYEQVGGALPGLGREPDGESHYISVTSVHGIIAARTDADLRRALDEADVVTPDGMPVVLGAPEFSACGSNSGCMDRR